MLTIMLCYQSAYAEYYVCSHNTGNGELAIVYINIAGDQAVVSTETFTSNFLVLQNTDLAIVIGQAAPEIVEPFRVTIHIGPIEV